jgi:hypothetical protein
MDDLIAKIIRDYFDQILQTMYQATLNITGFDQTVQSEWRQVTPFFLRKITLYLESGNLDEWKEVLTQLSTVLTSQGIAYTSVIQAGLAATQSLKQFLETKLQAMQLSGDSRAAATLERLEQRMRRFDAFNVAAMTNLGISLSNQA